MVIPGVIVIFQVITTIPIVIVESIAVTIVLVIPKIIVIFEVIIITPMVFVIMNIIVRNKNLHLESIQLDSSRKLKMLQDKYKKHPRAMRASTLTNGWIPNLVEVMADTHVVIVLQISRTITVNSQWRMLDVV